VHGLLPAVECLLQSEKLFTSTTRIEAAASNKAWIVSPKRAPHLDTVGVSAPRCPEESRIYEICRHKRRAGPHLC